jgi:hypothetical protein
MTYSAIQEGSYSTCLNLNSSNTAVDGPNFAATDGSDWSIKLVSPCRDAGTTPSPAIPYDYAGNPRIGPYDIGAYEVQYSRWTGATNSEWATPTNWEANLSPGTSSNVIITDVTNDPLISTYDVSVNQIITNAGGVLNVAADRLFTSNVLTNNGTLDLQPNARGTITTIVNNGTLKLESDATGTSSLIVSSFSGNDATIELFLTGGGTKQTYKWHFISSPVSSLPVSTFAPGSTIDLAQYVEGRPTLSLREGWVAYDGYIYSTGGMGGPAFSYLTPGKGYDYWDDADNKFTFTGQPNTGNISVSLGFSGNAKLHGFNLLGNPFSSGLNWDDIINDTYFPYPSNTSKTLYFTRDNVECSYAGGVGNPSDVTGIIPPMQGFFNKTYSTGNTITFPAAARVQGNVHARYKGVATIPLIRLSLTEDTLSDETVVRFDEKANQDLDNDFDAVKMFLSSENTSIYSSMNNIQYAINGQPFPADTTEIPIVVNLTTNGNHKITATQLQGLNNYMVTFTDKTTNFTLDLKKIPSLTFTASPGTLTDRFILKVSKIATGIENPHNSENKFNIYQSNSFINIESVSDEWNGKTGTIKVFDLSGKTITYMQHAEFWNNSLIQIPASGLKGLYFVEVKSGALRHLGKVMIIR